MKFEFTQEQLDALHRLEQQVDDKRALVLPSLWIVQRTKGYIEAEDIKYLEKTLGVRAMFYSEAIGFYSMFNSSPKGKFELKFCKTITCKLRGADALIKFAEELLGIKMGETTSDGLFSLGESECLGYCEKAPCMLCNLEQIDTLDEKKISDLIEKSRKNDASC
ncbi:hydrogenase expression protein [Helicobacter enhydrae]|uniref:Hydrogenase expression protein n=1 Tax=Helicobacter enhydrae TaxID=222136 RepID=A0A1B1U5H1_9HELI|nr:NAD(P)H-dependent oxidoreductase subunit E [Helicobacter enhydrae]ANV97935.1 hydrogenase expression protein [Helicobacter enhydrae]